MSVNSRRPERTEPAATLNLHGAPHRMKPLPANLPRVAEYEPPSGGEPMIEAIGPVEVLRQLRRVPRRHLRHQQGRGRRVPGSQRRRQEHDDEAAHRLPGAVVRARHRIAGFNMGTERLAGAERLGYLPENGPLYPDMSPRSLLTFFGDARGSRGWNCGERIEAVDLDRAIWKRSSASRSASSRRAIASASGMAQALLHDPDVLILDEPTAGLDPNQIREVRQTHPRRSARQRRSCCRRTSCRKSTRCAIACCSSPKAASYSTARRRRVGSQQQELDGRSFTSCRTGRRPDS